MEYKYSEVYYVCECNFQRDKDTDMRTDRQNRMRHEENQKIKILLAAISSFYLIRFLYIPELID